MKDNRRAWHLKTVRPMVGEATQHGNAGGTPPRVVPAAPASDSFEVHLAAGMFLISRAAALAC
ncbi:MAG: hypothetical protein ACREFY_03435, partial [Acetobacteraceae bacterium]